MPFFKSQNPKGLPESSLGHQVCNAVFSVVLAMSKKQNNYLVYYLYSMSTSQKEKKTSWNVTQSIVYLSDILYPRMKPKHIEIDSRDFNVNLMFTCIRYSKCIADVLWENKCTLMFCQRFSSEGEARSETGTESGSWIPHSSRLYMNHWDFIWTIERVFLFQHFSSFSCDDWHLNPQSTFNVCLQSIMDVYFVYCWFAKSMFCVTDNVVSSIVRLCSPLPQGCLIRTFCLCSKSMSYHMSDFFFVCLSFQFPFSSSVQN